MSTQPIIKVEDGKLMIVVDVSDKVIAAAELSKSQKTKMVSTTGGFTRYGNISVSLNVTAAK